MSPSATPATQSAAASSATKTDPSAPPSAISATPATQNESGCEIVPRLPCKKRRWMWDCATPATQNEGGCEIVPRLPHNVPHKCHDCHAKRRWMWDCATTATQNEGGCEIVPRMPRETKVDVILCHACHAKCRGITGDQNQPKRASQCHKCHACHAKRRWVWDCATPAAQNEGGCEIVLRLPRKTKVDVRLCHACHAKCCGVTRDQNHPKRATQCHECHACHAKPRWMWDGATPATWNQGGCHLVPRLPRKVSRHPRLKRAQARHPVPWVPRLPRKMCAKDGVCKIVVDRWCLTQLCMKDGTDGVWQSCVWSYCVWKMVCARWWLTDGVWSYCVWKMVWQMVCDKVVCEVIVCERWWLRDGVWQSCVCVWSYCVWKMVVDRWCVKLLCVKDGVWQSWCDEAEEAEEARDTESKTRNPQSCGEIIIITIIIIEGSLAEGSLEVKLPTIWTDEKQSRAEAERRERLEERRREEKESEERRCRCAKR